MKKIIKKITSVLFGANKQDQKIMEREQKTKKLIENELSDTERWQNNNELHPNWNTRTAILAQYIPTGASIIEFGAGVMHLKNVVQDYVKYTPSDIVKRYEETVVCDLNQPIDLDLSIYSVAVFSGVLEYVYDINKVFQQLESAKVSQVILSYCCSDMVLLSRAKNGWLSDYTKKELEEIFAKNHYRIQDYAEWNKQSLYNLQKMEA